MNDNDKVFEEAARFYKTLQLIRKNASLDRVAEECRVDPRFVLALACLVVTEDGL